MPDTLKVPFWDAHFHARQGKLMEAVARDISKRSCGGILMPNTAPPLRTRIDAARYLGEWRRLAPSGGHVAAALLTPGTRQTDEGVAADRQGLTAGVKWYPPGHQSSDKSAVTPEMLSENDGPVGHLLRCMEEEDIPLLLHGEVAEWKGEETDPYDRERIFVREVLPRIRDAFPKLRLSLEHISSAEAAEYMEKNGDPRIMVCTITAHHLALDRRDLYLRGFLRPDHHCLPVIKKESHRSALRALVQKRPSYILAGTDLAPHDREERKHTYCCFGGIYTGHCSVELYAQVLEELGCLDYLPAFLHGNARLCHGALVPEHPKPVTLVRQYWQVEVPIFYDLADKKRAVTPFGYFHNEKDRFIFRWKLAD